jgi:hypothetical protein
VSDINTSETSVEFLSGLLFAARLAGDININRFGKLERYQVVDAILLEVAGRALTPETLAMLKEAVARHR